MAEAHESADSKVISNAARRGELTGDLGGKLADAANNKSGDKPGMVSKESLALCCTAALESR